MKTVGNSGVLNSVSFLRNGVAGDFSNFSQQVTMMTLRGKRKLGCENTEPCNTWALPSGSLKPPGDRQMCITHGRIYIPCTTDKQSNEYSEKGTISS